MINIQQQLKDMRVEDSTSTQKTLPNRDSIKKFYIAPDSRTPILDLVDFVDFVSKTAQITTNESLNRIKTNKVTVNGEIQIDENFQLKSGDVVRVGVLGHFLQGPNNIAIVK
jgi:hypothetical protein